jgi:phosphate transport system permease protein
LRRRRIIEKIFRVACFILSFVGISVLAILLYTILRDGLPWLSSHFLTNFPSRKASQAGIYAAIWGSFWIMLLTALISVPIGIATAFYLEEYMPEGKFSDLVQVNIATLAGMPSIIYGLVGLTVFVRSFGMGKSVLAGALTLSLLILPVIVISAQGAIRAVPRTLRDAAYALGARKWQVTLGQVLPAAAPGIMTGIILALSRAMGETAPLILIGALSYVAFVPESINDSFTVLPVQIFNWAGRPSPDFHGIAAAGIIVLMVFLFFLNLIAIVIRERAQRYK